VAQFFCSYRPVYDALASSLYERLVIADMTEVMGFMTAARARALQSLTLQDQRQDLSPVHQIWDHYHSFDLPIDTIRKRGRVLASDRERFRAAPSMSSRTIRIRDKGGWSP